jgi:hypothetical protein
MYAARHLVWAKWLDAAEAARILRLSTRFGEDRDVNNC